MLLPRVVDIDDRRYLDRGLVALRRAHAILQATRRLCFPPAMIPDPLANVPPPDATQPLKTKQPPPCPPPRGLPPPRCAWLCKPGQSAACLLRLPPCAVGIHGEPSWRSTCKPKANPSALFPHRPDYQPASASRPSPSPRPTRTNPPQRSNRSRRRRRHL